MCWLGSISIGFAAGLPDNLFLISNLNFSCGCSSTSLDLMSWMRLCSFLLLQNGTREHTGSQSQIAHTSTNALTQTYCVSDMSAHKQMHKHSHAEAKAGFAIVKDVMELADICSSSACDCLVTEQAEDIYHPALSSKRQMTCPTPPPTPLRSFLLPPYHSCPTVYILSTTSPPSCYTHSLLLITIPLTSTAVSSSFFFHSHLMISPNTYSLFSLGEPAWPFFPSLAVFCLIFLCPLYSPPFIPPEAWTGLMHYCHLLTSSVSWLQ